MVVHTAWRGQHQDDGLDHRRVLIVGYSHYCKPEEMNDPALTKDIVGRVVRREATHSFWASIMHWFGKTEPADFWSRVGFINYIPSPIGNEDAKFATATEAQATGAADRLLDVMVEQNSDIAFVFSEKATWNLKGQLARYTPSYQRIVLAASEKVRTDYVFEDVHVERDGRTFHLILANHPQGAHRDTMTAMVQQTMADLR